MGLVVLKVNLVGCHRCYLLFGYCSFGIKRSIGVAFSAALSYVFFDYLRGKNALFRVLADICFERVILFQELESSCLCLIFDRVVSSIHHAFLPFITMGQRLLCRTLFFKPSTSSCSSNDRLGAVKYCLKDASLNLECNNRPRS
jgi:hypothetical protein